MLATLATTFTAEARASSVLAPGDQERVAAALEHDAEVMSNTGLGQLLADEPPAAREEVSGSTPWHGRPRCRPPCSSRSWRALLGLLLSFPMTRLRDPEQSGAAETTLGG